MKLTNWKKTPERAGTKASGGRMAGSTPQKGKMRKSGSYKRTGTSTGSRGGY